MKKAIKINFVDFWSDFDKNNNFLMNMLKDKYDIEICEDPDYLFYSCFGMNFLKYDCIRIFYTGEDLQPDFNLCDYAIGFSNIKFDDRYIRFPLYILYDKDFELAKNKHYFDKDDFANKKLFCNFIYSNSNANPNREKFYDMLSEYKKIDSGGKFKNNLGYCVGDKLEFQKKYKFSIAFENNSSIGYTTEKIVQAFAAKTIPIYWGNPKVSEEFNPESFINCHEYSSFHDVIKRVEEIDKDDELYVKILNEPIYKSGISSEKYTVNYLFDFLTSIIDREYSTSFRRSRYFKGLEYNNKMKRLRIIHENPVLKLFNKIVLYK